MEQGNFDRVFSNIKKRAVLSLFFCLISVSLSAQVWQWSIPVKNKSLNPRKNPSTAFLWIPSSCKNVKAVIVAQNNMEEISILEDSGFRKSMSQLDIAEVWITPLYDPSFDFTDGAWDTLQGVLDSLSAVSGYKEISNAPLIGMGHSACASFPYYLAACQPERTVACLSVSGQWPYVRGGSFAKDVWGNRNIDYIPSLETMGEYESAESWSREGLKERAAHPKMPLSMLACPAEGHFAYSPEKARYLALYIRKALRYGHVDPTQTGYLAESWKKDSKPAFKAAPVGKYKGNPDNAFWFFDKEMAKATMAYGERHRGKKCQLVGILQNGKAVEQQNNHLQLHPQFLTETDGKSIVLSPFFYDTVPGISPRPSNWTGKSVGTVIGHAKQGAPITLKKIAGPFVIKNDTVLEIAWNRAVNIHATKESMVFAVCHGGDAEYRPAVQQAQLDFPLYRTLGKVQKIDFYPIANYGLNSLSASIELKASASSRLPVNFYVNEGPCEVKNSILVFEKIPPKTKFPMKVTVTAWQEGNDEYQTAQPVIQTFFIEK